MKFVSVKMLVSSNLTKWNLSVEFFLGNVWYVQRSFFQSWLCLLVFSCCKFTTKNIKMCEIYSKLTTNTQKLCHVTSFWCLYFVYSYCPAPSPYHCPLILVLTSNASPQSYSSICISSPRLPICISWPQSLIFVSLPKLLISNSWLRSLISISHLWLSICVSMAQHPICTIFTRVHFCFLNWWNVLKASKQSIVVWSLFYFVMLSDVNTTIKTFYGRCRRCISELTLSLSFSLRKKCPYLELFWSVFFRIRTKYGHFSRSV